MIVVGGTYREVCSYPEWDRIYGSGGRAAVALSGLSPGTALHTYAYKGWAADVRATMAAFGVDAHVIEIEEELVFEYYHPLSKDRVPHPTVAAPDIEISGDVVLSFGMLEGSAAVTAKRVVYDPQSGSSLYDPKTGRLNTAFLASGSRAGELAYVVRDYMLVSPDPAQEPMDVATDIMSEEGATVVVARHAIGGASVYVGDMRPTRIPAYRSDTWFKIGAGDVFCAAFAYYWGELRLDPVAAADLAARSVAYFNDGHRLPIPPAEALQDLPAQPPGTHRGRIFLSGPSGTLSRRWLLDEAYWRLKELGSEVFSPFHEFGDVLGDRAADALAALTDCTALLALADGSDAGTSTLIGHARASGTPVVVLAEAVAAADLAVHVGMRCEIAQDFTSALYRAHLASLR
ncbi:carbohydrate kinase family protein [Methylobacterium durans]|uniref:Carbohydrate kinase family protein n=1 Tax=Methylobacterium durans TaxID=2202825 RepID=A0A2U8WB16_9HYPH|nr:carbohydrate kinase family protein [Methylobacterium durans]